MFVVCRRLLVDRGTAERRLGGLLDIGVILGSFLGLARGSFSFGTLWCVVYVCRSVTSNDGLRVRTEDLL